MAKYRKKPIEVEATRFDLSQDLPAGVQPCPTGYCVVTVQGVETPIKEGEWVITEGDGVHHYPCADAVFRATYDPVAL